MHTSGPPLDLSLLVLTTHHEFGDDFYPHLQDEAQNELTELAQVQALTWDGSGI